MSIAPGTMIGETFEGLGRYRIVDYLAEGRSSDLVLAADRAREDRNVVLKAPRHADNVLPEEVKDRHMLARREHRLMTLLSGNFPKPVQLIELENPALDDVEGLDSTLEPVIVYDLIEGVPLDSWLETNFPKGAPEEICLRILQEVALALDALHEQRMVLRTLKPSSVIIDDDGTVSLIGLGSASPREQKVSRGRQWYALAWTAPEIAMELSGKFVTPRADMWTLGAFAAWLATGEEPTGDPETPFTRSAYERLAERDEWLRILIAHCMQPLHKYRFAHMGRLLPWLQSDNLPTLKSDPFRTIALMDLGRRNVPETAKVGHLSGGALISRPSAERNPVEEASDGAPNETQQPSSPSETHTEQEAHTKEDAVENPRRKTLLMVSAALLAFFLLSAIKRLAQL